MFKKTKQINIPRILKSQKMFLPFEFNIVPAAYCPEPLSSQDRYPYYSRAPLQCWGPNCTLRIWQYSCLPITRHSGTSQDEMKIFQSASLRDLLLPRPFLYSIMRIKASEIHRSYLRYNNAQKTASLSSSKSPKILQKAREKELILDKGGCFPW